MQSHMQGASVSGGKSGAGKSLASNKIGLVGSILMGVAGTAPAFSIEVTTSTLLGAVGAFAPASIFYSGLIMLGIVFAFINLNRVMPSAGTSYTWASRVFGEKLGFMAGWALLSAVAIFMVSGTLPIANATLLLLKSDYVNHTGVIALISAMWLTLVSLLVLKGVKASSKAQSFITTFELIIMAAIIIGGIIIFGSDPIVAPSLEWIIPSDFSTTLFISGALIAMFFYWGWDVILNLSEETKNKENTPGLAAAVSIFILILIFVLFTALSLMGLTAAEVEQYNTNIIFILTEKVLGTSYGYLAVLIVLLSTLGTVETSMLQFSRTLFAKSRAGSLHPRYSKVHDKWETPWVATLVIWGIGMVLIALSALVPTVGELLSICIGTIGVLICFYLSLTGLACAYYFRDYAKLKQDPGQRFYKKLLSSITRFYYPMLSSLFLIVIMCKSFIDFDNKSKMIVLIAFTLALIPIYLNKNRIKEALK